MRFRVSTVGVTIVRNRWREQNFVFKRRRCRERDKRAFSRDINADCSRASPHGSLKLSEGMRKHNNIASRKTEKPTYRYYKVSSTPVSQPTLS